MTSWKIIAVIQVRDDGVSSNRVVVVEMEKSRQIMIYFWGKNQEDLMMD